MEIVRLTKDDYDELLSVLNTVFTKQNKREMDFEKEVPKMWVRDDEHMGRHLAVKENGKICAVLGVYPLRFKVGDTELLFSTLGNVATLPECVGKGYMKTLMGEAMKELERIGADASRLLGARQRYSRYGYEPSGTAYNFQVNAFTTKYCFDGEMKIEFREISYDDQKELAYIKALHEKKPVHVIRSYDETLKGDYDALCAGNHKIYIALNEKSEPVGYFSVSQSMTDIGDYAAENLETLKAMVYQFQQKTDKALYFSVPAHNVEEVRYFAGVSAGMFAFYPSRFKIINFDKVADAFLKVKKQSGAFLPEGESVIGIEDWGNLLIGNKNGEAYCKKTDREAAFTLNKLDATRFLFGPFSPDTVICPDAFLSALLPLPLSWCGLDRV